MHVHVPIERSIISGEHARGGREREREIEEGGGGGLGKKTRRRAHAPRCTSQCELSLMSVETILWNDTTRPMDPRSGGWVGVVLVRGVVGGCRGGFVSPTITYCLFRGGCTDPVISGEQLTLGFHCL